jgi:hypothetical protein
MGWFSPTRPSPYLSVLGRTPCARGHKVLMEVEDDILLIVGFLQGILLQQLGHHPVRLLNIIMILLISNINLLIIK